MTKKTRRQEARDAADKWMSLLVRYRDGNQCFCGSYYRISAGHLVGRTNYGLRWDLANVNAQCSPCNFDHNLPQRMHRYYYWHMQRYGIDAHNSMLLSSNKSEKEWTTLEMEGLADKFRKMLTVLEAKAVWDDKWLIDNGYYGTHKIAKLGRKTLFKYELVALGRKEKK